MVRRRRTATGTTQVRARALWAPLGVGGSVLAVVLAVTGGLWWTGSTGRAAPRDGEGSATHGPEATHRFLVQLDRPPLARYRGEEPGFPQPSRNARGRLLAESGPARAYLRLLASDQRRFETALARRLPTARVDWRYRAVFNGLAVAAPDSAAPILQRLPRVRRVWSTDRQWFRPSMDASLPLIGAPTFWQQTFGPNNAGRGVKVAVVDTGIDPDNPFFDDPDLSMPMGFPKGAAAYTTPKIIAARAYFRPDDPVDTSRDEPNPRDHLGHGSHVAGTIAGVNGTVFDLGGYQATVSGVAPKAQLMVYKVFYRAESGEEGAHEPELMAAFEDAVLDGADVISNSWGGPDVFGDADPSLQAYEGAVEAGVVVVFAAGNEGPGDGSVAEPGQYHRFITVANSGVGRNFTRYLEVTAPSPVDPGLERVRMAVGSISASFSDDIGPAPIRSSHLEAGGANVDGCAPFPPGTFDGAIALVERGTCVFTQKAENAADASALALVVFDNDPTEDPFAMSGDDAPLPAVMVSWQDGSALQSWIEAHPDAELALRQGYIPYDTSGQDQVVYSSSRGPTAESRLKPDLAAPGSPILSADAHRVGSSSTRPWGWKSGTSMATPHVAGAAALLVQHHPTWGPDEVKAALVGTATRLGLISWIDGGDARPWELGGGRLAVDRLLDIRLLATPAVLDGLELSPGQSRAATLHLSRVAPEVSTVTLRWELLGAPDGVQLTPGTNTQVGLDADGGADVTVSVACAPSAAPGDRTGWLHLDDDQGGNTVVPFHVRVLPDAPERDLLIVDLSFAQENNRPDVVSFYGQLADAVGITWDRAETGGLFRAPAMPELFRYRAVLVVTGDDRWNQYTTEARWSLDHLASYLLRGGRLILAGQGPLRDSAHDRFVALAGGATLEGQPLWDETLEQLRPQAEYRVISSDEPRLVTGPITLDASGTTGDLTAIGEVVPVQVTERADPWGHAVLQLTDGDLQAGGSVGLVYDPFPGWGTDALAEAHSHRAVVLGFGLEVMADPEPPQPGADPTPGSREELLLRAWQWVSDRVTLDVTWEQQDLHLTILADAVASTSGLAGFEVDFGDGHGDGDDADWTRSDTPRIEHDYAGYGAYEITVIARSDTGAAALWRQTLDLQPANLGTDGGVTDAEVAADASRDATIIEGHRQGCRCDARGGSGDPGAVPLLGLALLAFLAGRRRRSCRCRRRCRRQTTHPVEKAP